MYSVKARKPHREMHLHKHSSGFGRIPILLVIAALFAAVIYVLVTYGPGEAVEQTDATALDFINWGESQRVLKDRYTGAGTAIGAMGYRDLDRITGCETASTTEARRRKAVFSSADSGVEQCAVTVARYAQAEAEGDKDCLDGIRAAVEVWESDWDASRLGEDTYEFQDVYAFDEVGVDWDVSIRDKIWTIQRLAGWPVGDPVPGFENTRTVWNKDYAGWDPSANQSSCPVRWLQCFDKKQALYKDVAGMEALGEQEGLCIVELHPDIQKGNGMYAHFDVIREVAPDVNVVIASYARNQEDSMSRAADWLIENQANFNIVAARTSNTVFLETGLLKPGLQTLCGDETWCRRAGHVPYEEVCRGNPDDGGWGFAYKSVANLPKNYKPIAWQFERMRNAGIVPVKGAGHEGWKGALPYPDCSPALLSVGVVFAGTLSKGEKVAEGGWTGQGWRWHPSSYCEEKTIEPGQISCITNNAEKVGQSLSDGTVVSPILSPHPFESQWPDLGNAWTSPFVVAAVAVLKSENLAPDLGADEVVDLVHNNGDVVWDRRKCDQDPETDEPDGWLRVDFAFHNMELEPLVKSSRRELSPRAIQLLDHPWAYGCTDAKSPDTAPFHTDNVADFTNRRLNIGAAVEAVLDAGTDASVDAAE
ncbi:MAG: hypothetical protein ACR2P6_09350 [Gammaproteobacteria bacterium]